MEPPKAAYPSIRVWLEALLDDPRSGPMKLTLVDSDHRVAEALNGAFRLWPEVMVLHGDLLAVAENTVVSPANSLGFNAYIAVRAALRVAAAHPDRVRSLYCPGLFTGVGMVPASEAAEAMADAHRDWLAMP